MKVLGVFKHILIVVLCVVLLLGLPFVTSDWFAAWNSGVDVVSTATTPTDTPSGSYIVLINRNEHPDEEKLEAWKSFFRGEEVSYIFEDLSCSVATGDPNGQEMADNYRLRLPENQMSVTTCDTTLLVSRIQYNKFDIVVMSKEFADGHAVLETLTDNAIMLEVGS